MADRLLHIWAWISTGFLARNLLNLTSTFAVCKNWNSHSTTVGVALCQLGDALAFLQSAAVGPYIDTEFQEIIPLGIPLMGHKHGHSDTVYVE